MDFAPSTFFKTKPMHKLSMPQLYLIQSHIIKQNRQFIGCPTESIKKSAENADGKIQSFEIRAQAYLMQRKLKRAVPASFYLLKLSEVFRGTWIAPRDI